MSTTEERLGSWHKPVSRIVNYMIPQKKQESVLESVCLLKVHHDKTGMVYSGLDRVVEICYNNDSVMKDSLRCLGFRGDHDLLIEVKETDSEYDLCILSRQTNRRKLKSIKCNNFIKAFGDG